eukprot:Opistho-2@63672
MHLMGMGRVAKRGGGDGRLGAAPLGSNRARRGRVRLRGTMFLLALMLLDITFCGSTKGPSASQTSGDHDELSRLNALMERVAGAIERAQRGEDTDDIGKLEDDCSFLANDAHLACNDGSKAIARGSSNTEAFDVFLNSDQTLCWEKGREPKDWKSSAGWVWVYVSATTTKSGQRSVRFNCHGVVACSRSSDDGCKVVALRPRTGDHGKEVEKKQVGQSCPTCHLGTLRHIKCKAVLRRIESNETSTVEHCGIHHHPKPLQLKATPTENAQLATLVTAHGGSLRAKKLQTGGYGVTAYEMSDAFGDLSYLRHTVRTVSTKIFPLKAFKRDGFWVGLKQLKATFPLSFPSGMPHLCIFDESMRAAFLRAVLAPIIGEQHPAFYEADGRQWKMALLTDATYSYFKEENAYLCMSSVFCTVLKRWRPICMTVMSGLSHEDYLNHFTTLFNAIPDEHIDELQSIATSVVDFSEAQLEGFIRAYVARKSAWASARGLPYDEAALREEAMGAIRGCEFHYKQSATRVSRNHNVVPFRCSEDFLVCTNELLEITNTDDYDATIQRILATYPLSKRWVDWWNRPGVRGLIFPAHMYMSADQQEKAPSTTNAEESLHNDIHTSVGLDFPLIEGVGHLVGYAATFEKDYQRELVGAKTRYNGDRRADKPGNQLRKTTKDFVNDGRAPDTSAALLNGTLFSPLPGRARANARTPLQSNRSPGRPPGSRNLIAASNHGLNYPGFQFLDNSCYFDATAELLYAFYCNGGERIFSKFSAVLSSVASTVGIALLVNVFSRRRNDTPANTSSEKRQEIDNTLRDEVLQYVRDTDPRASLESRYNSPWNWLESLFRETGNDVKKVMFPEIEETLSCSNCKDEFTHRVIQKGPVIVPEGLDGADDLAQFLNSGGFVKQRTGKMTCPMCKDFSCPSRRAMCGVPELLVLERNVMDGPNRNHVIYFPEVLTVYETKYHLFGHVLSKGGRGKHYTAMFCTKNGYYDYDDIRADMQCQLVSNTRAPKSFSGALLNTTLTFYVQEHDFVSGRNVFSQLTPSKEVPTSTGMQEDDDSDLDNFVIRSNQSKRQSIAPIGVTSTTSDERGMPTAAIGVEGESGAHGTDTGIPVGFANVGLSCFMNVALRMLLAIPGLVAAITSEAEIEFNVSSDGLVCVRALAKLSRLMSEQSRSDTLSKAQLEPILAECLSPHQAATFKTPLQQEDAEEH